MPLIHLYANPVVEAFDLDRDRPTIKKVQVQIANYKF